MPPTVAESPRPLADGRARQLLLEGAALLASMLVAGAVSALLLRQDANWDLRNYHFYNAWAFVHGRLGWDLAPAQLQTFLNPLLDLPFYWMVEADWPPRLVAFVIALPAGVGAFFLAKILLLLFRDTRGKERWGYIALAFLVGITASGPVSLLGSTMNDWPGTALVMLALWLLIERDSSDAKGRRSLAVAGLIAGIASGLKLTNAPYAVGLCVALLVALPSRWRSLRDAVGFGIAVLIGVLLSSGAWMWTLYAHFDSPVFPFFNDIFRSPWWDATRLVDLRFRPQSLLAWLTLPLRFRDLRLPLLYVALIGVCAAWLIRHWRRPGTPAAQVADPADKWRFVLVFCAGSFLVWAALFTVPRYLMPLELLSGAILICVLRLIVPLRWLPAAVTLAATLAILTVRYRDLGRIEYGHHYFTVSLPPVAPNAVVLITADQPMAFVLPFFPPDGRFLGANNNLNQPQRQNRLAREIASIVRQHDGPLYALAYPPGSGTAALDAYGLRRVEQECAPIVSNMSPNPLQLCRLERAARQS